MNENLKGTLVYLRPPEPEDVDVLYHWENNMKLWRYSDTTYPFSRFILKKYIENASTDIYEARQLRFIIAVIIDGTPVGAIDLFDFDPYHQRAGVGVFIHESHQNNGYAKEALRLLVWYSQKVLNLHQIWCTIESENKKSRKLFHEAGFSEVGIRKEWLKRGSVWADDIILQKLL
jgi:diamine N-acetyltransferase